MGEFLCHLLKEMLIINVINVSFLFIFVGNGIIGALVSCNRGFLCYLLKETLINVINVSFYSYRERPWRPWVSCNWKLLRHSLKETLINIINVSFLFILIGNGLGDL